MNRDLLLSVALHAIVIAAVLLSSPLDFGQKPEYGEVIRVNVVSASDLAPAEPEAVIAPQPQVPRALQEEIPEIPIDDPTTRPAAEIDEPEEEPIDEPPPEKETVKHSTVAQPSDRTQTGTRDGQTEVENPGGTGSLISGVAVDNASFNYPYWFTMAWNKINQNFRVPVAIDGQVYCDVYFQVIKSGRVVKSKITNPSGIPAFDNACLGAVERSAPFPPLPREFLDEIIGITITFTN